ncbi:hypothetical protein FRC05_005500 [Tulasnella sp. 425]|nr:hypothetical protein FRC05_005500 [Tulasnella sp. 425]
MDLRVGLSKPLDIKRLLTSPTPALESLTVGVNQVPSIFWSWDGPEVEEFALSEGAPLKHLNLKDFTLTMESHRFSNLITLFLDGSAVPGSLGTLLQILRTSAQLEQLTISNDTQRDEAHQSSPLITLPRLKNLKIDRITVDYCMSLLASIHAPACSQAYVQDEGLSDHAESLDALVWQPEGIQAAALLGFTSSSPESPISGVPATVSITTTISVSHNVTVVRVKDKDGFRSRYLAFRRREPLKLLKRIGESLLHLLYPSSSSLVDFRLMFPHDLLDLRPWSSTLESLKLPGYAASLSAMEQLGQCIATPSGNGAVATESWMCPNLQDITLHMPEEEEEECAIYIAALRSLVRKRWSGEDGDLAPAIQPNRFLIISPRYKEFQDVQSEIQRVLPFFTFNWG